MIKNKILTYKLIFQFLLFNLASIFNNTTFQLIYILEASMLIVCAGFFTSNTTGTIHYQVLIFFIIFKILFYNWQRIPKSIYIWLDCSLKMTNFTFVMVTHI